MIKTSTNRLSAQFLENFLSESIKETEQRNEQFYQRLKPTLEELRREPSAESIAKILAYAKQK